MAIPATFYLVLRQQEIRGRAAPATTLSFDQTSLSKNVGDVFTLAVQINTGTNTISGAELHIQYDSSKLVASSITMAADPFLPVLLNDGTISSGGFAFITLGSQPSQPKTGTGTLATITFRATASTGGAPTLIRFTTDTKVAGTGEAGNVLASQPAPASVTIGVATTSTPTPSSTPTATPIKTPTPTSGVGGTTPTPLPTSLPGSSPTPTKAIGGVSSPSATPLPGEKGGLFTPQPTAAGIPVAAEITPTVMITVGGILLFIAGVASLLVL